MAIAITLVVLFIFVPLIAEAVLVTPLNALDRLASWAVRRRQDGTYSSWQIISQQLLIVLSTCIIAISFASIVIRNWPTKF